MRTIFAGTSLALLIAGTAMAQDMPPPEGQPPMAMAPLKRADVPALVAARFAQLDMNHDGVLTEADRDLMREQHRAEMVAGMKEHRDRAFAAMDANKDGVITRQEFDNAPPLPPPPLPPHGGPSRPAPMRGGMGMGLIGGRRMLEEADANHDGKVTLAEAQKAALDAFDKADVNHDGVLDRDEMMVAMRERMAKMGGHRWGGPGGDDMRPLRKD